jgi:hypothetical protein
MNKPTRLIRLIVAFTVFIVSIGAQGQQSSIDLDLSRKYFNELNALCRQDGGRLWGVSLCGPTLLVSEDTRDVVANYGGRSGFTKKDDLFVGKWPVEKNIANTTVAWAGVNWTMMVWPLPADQQDRAQLMLHESFHRVQDDLGIPGSNPPNGHLDTRDGRVWLQLEWRALANALMERGSSRKMAIADALAFREYRHSMFPQAAKEEKALEMNEGLAEYTGVKMSSISSAEFVLRAGCALRQARNRPTFVRSFAYISGPVYGALLDESAKDWRRKVRAVGDLGTLLRSTHAIRLPQISRQLVLGRAVRYNGDALIEAETARDNARQELLKKYRARFLEQPVLTLPLSEKVQYSFNPNNLVPLDENRTIYPTLRVSDEWGILEVADGALLIREQGRVAQVRISLPANLSVRPVNGPGWKLLLKEGWEFGSAEGKDHSLFKRK